jgi:hypothetical protein
MAKEFYDPLPAHTSWPGVTWRFITGASSLSLPGFSFASDYRAQQQEESTDEQRRLGY